MKKFASVLAAGLLFAALATGCGSAPAGSQPAEESTNTALSSAAASEASEAQDTGDKEPVTLRLMQYKPEITNQVYAMAEEYNRQFPHVTIEVEILQEDYLPVLKSKINAGVMPDIFMSGGYTYNEVLADYSYDFTGDAVLDSIPESALAPATWNGGIYGVPVIAEGYGIIYNKDIFEECGITELPKTLEEFEAACAAIAAKGYIPIATGYKEPWILSHVFTKYYATDASDSGEDFYDFAQEMQKTYKFGENMPASAEFYDYIDVVMQYCEEKPAETDFNGQISMFAQKQAAMFSNGTWAEGAVTEIDPSINMGFLTVPGSDASQAKLMVDTNVLYCVNKDSENLEEAKNWLNWLVTSDYGEQFIVDECGFIPTVEGWHLPDSMLARDLSEYLQSGNSYSCAHGYYPDGYFDQSGAILQTYVVGTKDAAACNEELNTTWEKIITG